MTKGAANTPYDASSDSIWFSSGKKFVAKVTARKP
jgi:hypothetical protein